MVVAKAQEWISQFRHQGNRGHRDAAQVARESLSSATMQTGILVGQSSQADQNQRLPQVSIKQKPPKEFPMLTL